MGGVRPYAVIFLNEEAVKIEKECDIEWEYFEYLGDVIGTNNQG